MIHIFLNILTLQLSHALNLIQVHHKTFFVGVCLLNALPAEYGFMIGTIKMLDSVLMGVAELLGHRFFIFVVEIEVAVC